MKVRGLLIRRERAPVMDGPRQIEMTENDLHGFRQTFRAERGAQDRVTLVHLAPSPLQGGDIKPPAEAALPLIGGVTLHGTERVKERLHRGQRADILDVSITAGEKIDTFLVEPGERKIRRGATAAPAREAMPDDETQGVEIVIRDALDGFRAMAIRAEGKTEFEAVAEDEAVDFQEVTAPGARAVKRFAILGREAEKSRAGDHLIELAEVVEDQSRLWLAA